MCEVVDGINVCAPSNEGAHFVRTRRMFAAATAAAVALSGPILTSGEAAPAHIEARQSVRWIPEAIPLPPTNLAHAPTEVAPQAKAYVRQLMEQPQTTQYEDILAGIQKKHLYTTFSESLTTDDLLTLDYRYNTTIAGEFGLTIVNPLPALDKLQQLQNKNAPFTDKLAVTQDYLAQLGLHLKVGTSQEALKVNFKPLTQANKQEYGANQALFDLITVFSRAPKQYYDFVRQSNELTIELANNEDASEKNDKGDVIGTYAGYATYDFNKRQESITFGVTDSSITADLQAHELFHLIDPLLSGGSDATQKDPAYEALNNGIAYQNDEKKVTGHVAATTTANDVYSAWQTDVMEARQKKEYTTACSLAKKGDAAISAIQQDEVFISSYAGRYNVAEDKAETESGLTSGGNGINVRLNLDAPSIYRKYMLLTERMAQYAPRIVGYFITKEAVRGYTHTYRLPKLTKECDQPVGQIITKGG